MGRFTGYAAGFEILINGANINDFGFDGLVTSLVVDMSVDKADYCRIEFANINNIFTFVPLFQSGNLMTIRMGWSKDGLQDIGEFILKDPRFRLRAPEVPSGLVVEGYGKEILMFDNQKRRIFINRTDSQIAADIAAEYGFTTNIEDTQIRYPQISQMGISDIEFLRERAELYGYVVYIEDDILHFHSLRPDENPVAMTFEPSIEETQILDADIVLKTIGGAADVTVTTRDILSKTTISRTSDERLDAVSQRLGQSRRIPISTKELIQKNFVAFQRFEENKFHQATVQEADNVAFALGTASQYVLKGVAESRGDERLRPRRTIQIDGESFGALEGLYYVTSVVQSLNPKGNGYHTFFTFVSSFLNELDNIRNLNNAIIETRDIVPDRNVKLDNIVQI